MNYRIISIELLVIVNFCLILQKNNKYYGSKIFSASKGCAIV